MNKRKLRLLTFYLKENRTSLIFCLVLITICLYVLIKVQYQTGIEIIPGFPIDDSGFETYNESLLQYSKTSPRASSQNTSGFLLCWAMTTSIYHKTRVPAIVDTWLKRCDAGHVFTNSDRFLSDDIPYHTIFEGLPESYFKLFWKTRLALYYVYRNVSSNFDWYFKGDDDTYLIVDNLKKYLKQFDPMLPYYIGYRLKRRTRTGYNAGGSGYVLSRGAMRLYADRLFHNREACPYHEWEDYAVARCFSSIGIYPIDSRDSQGRQRFLPWRYEQHFNADLTQSFQMDPIKYWGSSIYHQNLISLHHLRPDEIRLIDGLLYSIAPAILTHINENNKSYNNNNNNNDTWNEATTTHAMEETLEPP